MDDIQLTHSQQNVYDKLCHFVDSDEDRVFILKGYAGTGKTTLMRFLVQKLIETDKRYELLASTGRASKVLSNLSGQKAKTIHGMIYSFKDLNQDLTDIDDKVEPSGQLLLMFEPTEIDYNMIPETVYIIDEASMISDVVDKLVTQAKFGTGRLLQELLNYDVRKESKFIFIGDPCQLPPIYETFSPALSASYFADAFGIKAEEETLTEIVRQENGSSIITASKKIRSYWANAPEDSSVYGHGRVWGKFPFKGCRDIKLHHEKGEMLDDYVSKIKDSNYDNAVYICRGNGSCFKISMIVRQKLGFDLGHVQKGDLLMVIQNNLLSELMNGDLVKVLNVEEYTEHKASLTFRRITMEELFTHRIISQLLLEDTVNQNVLNLTSNQQKALFVDFARRMKKEHIKQRSIEYRHALRNDPYLNALRCSYGYAITCHKAQGGEWEDVYIDVARNITLNPTKSTYQWIYTAMTRSSKRLHLIDDFYIE
jgi:ATP-dependent exoDNAse (exonuclease V) alpha subunit